MPAERRPVRTPGRPNIFVHNDSPIAGLSPAPRIPMDSPLLRPLSIWCQRPGGWQ